jgi:hypothetical protein
MLGFQLVLFGTQFAHFGERAREARQRARPALGLRSLRLQDVALTNDRVDLN